MRSRLAFYSLLTLVDLGGSLLIVAVQMAAIFEAQRKGLTAFGRWLVPFTLASIVFLAAEIFGVVSPNLGINPYSIRLCRYGLNIVGTALGVVAAFQIWRMIRGWPIGAGAGGETPPGAQATGRQQEDVWPPPPTGPA